MVRGGTVAGLLCLGSQELLHCQDAERSESGEAQLHLPFYSIPDSCSWDSATHIQDRPLLFLKYSLPHPPGLHSPPW